MVDVEARLQRTADAIRAAAAETPLPAHLTQDIRPAHRRRLMAIAAGVAVAAGGLVAIVTLADFDQPVPATQPPGSSETIDRFVIDGMHVDSATEYADGESSEIFLNTPVKDSDSALPAVIITTGAASIDDLSDWERTRRTVRVLDQSTRIWSLNGDPLGVKWTTARGTAATLITEGVTVDEFPALIDRLRAVTAGEWSSISEEVGYDLAETRGSTGVDAPTSTEPIALPEGNPHLLIDREGWVIEHVDTYPEGGGGEVKYTDGEHTLTVHWRPAAEFEQESGGLGAVSVDVLGRTGSMSPEDVPTDLNTVLPPVGNYFLEIRGDLGSVDAYRDILDSLVPVDVDTWRADVPSAERTEASECVVPESSDLNVAGEPPWRQYEDYKGWTRDGCGVRIDHLADRPGPEHCGYQSVRIITTGSPVGARYSRNGDEVDYVRDPDDLYGLASEVDLDADLPPEGRDTGYRSVDGEQLWVDPEDASLIYIVDGDGGVERWPRSGSPRTGSQSPACS